MCFFTTIIEFVCSLVCIIWEWKGTSDAGNFGSLLSGIGTLGLVLLALAWARQKRVEKRSDVAEYAMDNLYVFCEEIKNWLKFSDSWFVYSRNSEEN